MSQQRPFAVLDIDGTLIRWQLYHAVADELARQGYFDENAYQKVRAARLTWQKRASETSFQDYEEQLLHVVQATLVGLSEEALSKANQAVMAEYQDQVYTYTRDLISSLKAQRCQLLPVVLWPYWPTTTALTTLVVQSTRSKTVT
jgi:phosphoserine phosphatase